MSRIRSRVSTRGALSSRPNGIGLCEPLEPRRLMAAGDLDLTFGEDGRTIQTSNSDAGVDVVVQADGKVVTLGALGMWRHNANGTPDINFGTNGRVALVGQGWAAASQSNGRIVVAATTFGGYLSATRYLTSGAIDTSFGTAGTFTSQSLMFPRDVAIQPDGKIVFAGSKPNVAEFAVTRLNSNGTLDTSFGTPSGTARSGTRTFPIESSGSPQALAINTNGTPSTNPRYGTIVVAGSANVSPTMSRFAAARLRPNGDLDTTFSTDGKTTVAFNTSAGASSVVIQPTTGKIVMAGSAGLSQARDFALARLKVDGTLDTTFGAGGRIVADFNGDDAANDLITIYGNKLLVGGYTTGIGNFALACYDQDGHLDSGFKGNGKVTTDFGGFDYLNALALAPGDKFVAVGGRQSNSRVNVAIARYFQANPTVTVSSADSRASETGSNTATIQVTRNGALPQSTRVYYTVAGTASAPGSTTPTLVDYSGVPSTPVQRFVDIPAGATTTQITITPTADTRNEGIETVVVTLSPDNAYIVGSTNAATVTISDSETAFVANVNFQPATATPFSSYTIDSGAAFGTRDGLTYGWDATNATARDRDSSLSPNQGYDTLIHTQLDGANRRWEIAVPNGRYFVHLVAGDAGFFNSHYRFNVEGLLTIDDIPTTSDRWSEGTAIVDVTDGRLTITNASGAVNNKLCFIEIEQRI